jgi:hypothetical protein
MCSCLLHLCRAPGLQNRHRKVRSIFLLNMLAFLDNPHSWILQEQQAQTQPSLSWPSCAVRGGTRSLLVTRKHETCAST